jgi:hypothetical protein
VGLTKRERLRGREKTEGNRWEDAEQKRDRGRHRGEGTVEERHTGRQRERESKRKTGGGIPNRKETD